MQCNKLQYARGAYIHTKNMSESCPRAPKHAPSDVVLEQNAQQFCTMKKRLQHRHPVRVKLSGSFVSALPARNFNLIPFFFFFILPLPRSPRQLKFINLSRNKKMSLINIVLQSGRDLLGGEAAG